MPHSYPSPSYEESNNRRIPLQAQDQQLKPLLATIAQLSAAGPQRSTATVSQRQVAAAAAPAAAPAATGWSHSSRYMTSHSMQHVALQSTRSESLNQQPTTGSYP
jgi:hypothetical protein